MRKLFLSTMLVFTTIVSANNSSRIIYQDSAIIITAEGVFSKRTGKQVEFKESINWKEEDFFTQQEKYCEKPALTN